MKKIISLSFLSASLFLGNQAFAGVFLSPGEISIAIDLEGIRTDDGGVIPSTGVAVLVVDVAGDGFAIPAAGNLTPEDEEVVAIFDLSETSLDSDSYSLLATGIPYGMNWEEGQPLGLFWFPTLAVSDPVVPGDGDDFGFYSDPLGTGDGDDWVMPSNNALLVGLRFFTELADASVALGTGSNPGVVGNALFEAGGAEAGSPTEPTSVAAGESPNTITITWEDGDAPSGGLVIERRREGSSEWEVVGHAANGESSFSDETVKPGKAYTYRVIALNGFDAVASAGQPSIEALRSKLVNISTRGVLGSGNNALIVGFVSTGPGNMKLLSRTVGPQLGVDYNLVGFSPDPFAEWLKRNTATPPVFESIPDGFNDDWEDDDGPAIAALTPTLGAFALDAGSKDSALILEQPAGIFTAVAGDDSPDDGIATVEIYDAKENPDARLVNLSTRGFVGTNDDVLIGGFVIEGQVNKTMLIRGIGPGLESTFALAGTIPNPRIELRKLNTLLSPPVFETVTGGVNDDWDDDNGVAIANAASVTGGFALVAGSTDAALLIDLAPGVYSAILAGTDDEVGLALVELYEVEEY